MPSNQSDNARIKFVGHSTTLVEMSGTRILTDPVLRSRFTVFTSRLGFTAHPVDVNGVDAVLLSHMHFDHMDYASLRMIPKDVPIVAPAGAGRYLERKVGHEITEMRVGQTITLGNVEVQAMPSLHRSGFYWPMWFPRTVLSYMLAGSQTVYFIGDTALFDEMHDIGRSFDIDAALMPVWGIGPYLRGDHMNPAQAAEAVSRLDARVAIPIHWGSFHPMVFAWNKMSFLKRPPHVFQQETAKRAPETDVRILVPGQETVISDVASEAPARVAATLRPAPALG